MDKSIPTGLRADGDRLHTIASTKVLLVTALLFVALGSCAPRLDLQRVYRIGTDNTYPYHFVDEHGEIQGMVGEVIQEAARRTGVRLEWVVLKEGPQSALTTRKVDLWPLLSVQNDLWPQFHFTRPYLTNAFVWVAVDPRFDTPAGQRQIHRVASVRFPLVMRIVRQSFPESQSIGFQTRQDALAAVCDGRADVAVMEARTLQQFALRRPAGCEAKDFVTAGVDVKARQLAIASLTPASAAADYLRAEIDRMLADGSVDRITHKWSYFYGGEANTLFRESQALAANRVSYWLTAVLALLSALLLLLLVRIRHAQRAAVAADAAKSVFLANMSHEIRTPMNGIIGMTDLALELSDNKEQREYLGMAQSSAHSLLALLNDILDLSRIEAGKLLIDPIAFNPGKVVDEVVQLLSVTAKAKGLAIHLSRSPGVPECVLGDPGRLRQVLVNLIGNAVKFTEKGRIDVSLDTRQEGRQLGFAIRDTGIGIAPQEQRTLFRPFAQADGSISRKYGGSGLGLAISSKLVRLMGGSMSLQSEPGKGTSFDIVLPCCLAPAPAPATAGDSVPADSVPLASASAVALPRASAQAVAVPDPPTSPMRILLAEDNVVNQKVAARLLAKNGHSVLVVSNGRQALEALERESFDVVLMDVQMPEMDGFEATACIRARELNSVRHQPVIAMTAHAMAGDRERCLAAGMDGYVSKPVQIKSLLTAISEVASGPRSVETLPQAHAAD